MLSMFSRGSASKESVDVQPQKSPSISSGAPSNFNGPARPIRLVYCDDKGMFRMDAEAVAALQLVKEPVGVVAVCGRARQGKSFILNQLLGKSSGFKVASTHCPCTKGLWLWSAPIGRTALDGTKYNLLLLDSEGIDAYDQTGTYSTQIFSLAVLLSSMFIYNQMGGIDEAALDRLSLVTQVTKHIRVRASGGRGSTSELGQFSPVFIWLLRDFYLDLVEDNRQITPRDYLELALRAVQGGGKDISAKNEIRESIRALFPDRECFTLVRPLNNENDLQRLDQISLDKMRPEFKSGLNSLIKFVFERTRPKQIGATVMTGPILVRITETYLDALNNGAVPTIFSSWQSVEEAECRSAYDSATEVYMQTFDRSRPPEEGLLREAHDEAVQKAVTLFNTSAVGAGTTRQKYESLLQKFMKKGFEDYKKNAFMAADIFCSSQVKNMESTLRTTCLKYDAKMDQVLKILDDLLSDYETKCHGPRKWQKLAKFLQQSLEGPIHDFVKNQVQKTASEMSSLQLKCRSMIQQTDLLKKQLESTEKQKSEYLKRYEDAINDKNKIADDYMSRIANLQSNCSSLNEKCARISRNLESTKQESEEWKKKYDHILSTKKSQDDQNSAELMIMKSKISASEARLAAIKEKADSSQEEAEEWREKYEISVREAKYALEKTAAIQDRTSKHAQQREDVLRSEFADILADKDTEIKEKACRIEEAEQHLTTLSLELKAAVSKVASYEAEVSSLGAKVVEVGEKLEAARTKAQSFEKRAEMLQQEKAHLEQAYGSGAERVQELQERCREAERDAKRAGEVAERARAEAAAAEREKAESERAALEGAAAVERAERRMERVERERGEAEEELKAARTSGADAAARAAELERAVEERERRMQSHLRSNNEQRADTMHVLEKLLESERVGRAEANARAEDLSVQLQTTQAKLDSLQQELTAVRLAERPPAGKRTRAEDAATAAGRWSKRPRSDEEEVAEEEEAEEEDYRSFTVQRLKQELTLNNHGDHLLRLRNPNKKDIVALYERLILPKS